jgi:hypothetical protein
MKGDKTMKRQTVRLLAILLTILLTLSACGKETEENRYQETEENRYQETEENRYIDCEPGYKQPKQSTSFPITPEDSQKVSAYSYNKYLKAKEQANFSNEDWLPWEQFSSLGEFYRSFWWAGQPGSSQYNYQYTDPATGNTWIYHVGFEKIREDSGVTNIKEYDQWYYGKEILNNPIVMAHPTLTENDFKGSDLTDIDLDDPLFDKVKSACDSFGDGDNYYGFHYYIDDTLQLFHDGYNNIVRDPMFVYNGWVISISKHHGDDPKPLGLDSTDCDIIQRLTNINTYKQAIEELMDPANAATKPE